MKNIKLYIIGFAVVFLMATVVTVNIQARKIKRMKAENTRLENNWKSEVVLNDDLRVFNLKEKELSEQLRHERDSLAKALQIKPKQIEKIITITNTIIDTVFKAIPATLILKDTWTIHDSSKCFKWHGIAQICEDTLLVHRTLFEYNNKTTETFYKIRPHKFLFCKFGRWIYRQKISSDCGTTEEKIINFIK